jgi:hypothetical protein
MKHEHYGNFSVANRAIGERDARERQHRTGVRDDYGEIDGSARLSIASRCRCGLSIKCVTRSRSRRTIPRARLPPPSRVCTIRLRSSRPMWAWATRRRRARNPREPSSDLGEIAVDEYATTLARSTGPGFVPLVLFEDPDVMDLRIARLRGRSPAQHDGMAADAAPGGTVARRAGTGREDQHWARHAAGAV